jgi:hypothetical protein
LIGKRQDRGAQRFGIADVGGRGGGGGAVGLQLRREVVELGLGA